MNSEDLAYYARLEADQKAAQQRVKLADLREHGVRIRMRSGAGSVAVNASGVVTDVVVDRANCEYMAEEVLADYIAEAIHAAQSRAAKTHRNILTEEDQ